MLLCKRKESLKEKKNIITFGTIYQGRSVKSNEKENLWIYPLLFFYRRAIFIFFTVYLREFPDMTMILHQLLTVSTLIYISKNDKMFTS